MKININYENNYITPLIYAINFSNLEIIEILLKDKRIEINYVIKNNKTALIYAIKKNAFIYAIKEENFIIELLLKDKRIEINYINKNNETALIYAIKINNMKK